MNSRPRDGKCQCSEKQNSQQEQKDVTKLPAGALFLSRFLHESQRREINQLWLSLTEQVHHDRNSDRRDTCQQGDMQKSHLRSPFSWISLGRVVSNVRLFTEMCRVDFESVAGFNESWGCKEFWRTPLRF